MTETKDNNLLAKLGTAIDSVTLNQVRHILNNLSPPDVAHQLETAPPKFRHILWELVDPEISGEVLQELSDEIQLEFLNEMDGAEVASLTEGLDVDDIVDILQQLPDQMIPEVLQAMSVQDRQRVESVLTYDEETAGGLMDTEIITVRPDITVDVVLRYLRRLCSRTTTRSSRRSSRSRRWASCSPPRAPTSPQRPRRARSPGHTCQPYRLRRSPTVPASGSGFCTSSR